MSPAVAEIVAPLKVKVAQVGEAAPTRRAPWEFAVPESGLKGKSNPLGTRRCIGSVSRLGLPPKPIVVGREWLVHLLGKGGLVSS